MKKIYISFILNILCLFNSLSQDELIEAIKKNQLEKIELSISQPNKRKRASQRMVNEALWHCALNGKLEAIKILMTKGKIAPTLRGLDIALRLATFKEQKEVMKYLLTLNQRKFYPTEHGLTKSFEQVVLKSNFDLTSFYLSSDSELVYYPEQDKINYLLGVVANLSNLEMTNHLLCNENRAIYPNNYGINEILIELVEKKMKEVIKVLFSIEPNKISVDQYGANLALSICGKIGDIEMFEFFLNLLEEKYVLPNQQGINRAFISAVNNNHLEFVQHILRNLGAQRRPDAWHITLAHRDARANELEEMEIIIEGELDEIERVQARAQRLERFNLLNADRPGMAFEIHHYADNKDGTSMKLIDKIFDKIRSICVSYNVPLLKYEDVFKVMENLIDLNFSPEERHFALEASLYRLHGDKSYEKDLTLILSFLTKLHPESMGIWVQGFVGESIVAYKNSKNKSSCTKGIRERLGTGLRGVNKELDILFKKAEGGSLFLLYIKLWNPISNGEKVIEMLKEGGLSSSDSGKKAANIFMKLFKEEANINGLSIDSYKDELEIIADSIEDNFDDLKKFL